MQCIILCLNIKWKYIKFLEQQIHKLKLVNPGLVSPKDVKKYVVYCTISFNCKVKINL